MVEEEVDMAKTIVTEAWKENTVLVTFVNAKQDLECWEVDMAGDTQEDWEDMEEVDMVAALVVVIMENKLYFSLDRLKCIKYLSTANICIDNTNFTLSI